MMGEAFGWGLIAASSLLVGGFLALRRPIGLIVDPRRLVWQYGLHVRKKCQHRTNRSGGFADVECPKKPT